MAGLTAPTLNQIFTLKIYTLFRIFKLYLALVRNSKSNETKCKRILNPSFTRDFWPIAKIHKLNLWLV